MNQIRLNQREVLLQRIVHRAREQGFLHFRDLVRMFPTEASVDETSKLVDTLADLGIQVRYEAEGQTRQPVHKPRGDGLLNREEEVTLARRIINGQSRRIRAAMRCPRTVQHVIRAARQVTAGNRRLWEVLTDYEGSHPDSDDDEARAKLAEIADKLQAKQRELDRLSAATAQRKDYPKRADRIRTLRGSMTRLLKRLDFRDLFINQLLRPLARETARAEGAMAGLRRIEQRLELPEGALGGSAQVPDTRMRGFLRQSKLSHQEKEQLKREFKNCKRALRAAEHKTDLPADDLLEIGRNVRLGEREANLAKQTLVEANQRLVISIARRYPHYSMDFLDLVQEGNLGLMRAADRFDPERGFRFGTYAAWWVRQSIGRLVAEQGSAVRIPPHVQESLHKVNRIIRRIVLKTGKEPPIEVLAERLGKSPERIKEIIQAGWRPVSTETKVGDSEDSASLLDFMPDPDANPEEEADHRVQQAVLQEAMSALSEREQEIIILRFSQGLTLQEVGDRFQITRERTRQLQAQALDKMRKRLKADLLRKLIRDEPLKVAPEMKKKRSARAAKPKPKTIRRPRRAADPKPAKRR